MVQSLEIMSTIEKSRLSPTAIAATRFADAMMVSFARIVRVEHIGTYIHDNPLNADVNQLEFRRRLVEGSDSKCGSASNLTIEHLHRYSSDNFDYLLGLKSHAGPFINPGWKYHELALAKVKDSDIWFAGSAANASQREDLNFATKMYSGKLNRILEEIQNDVKGTWPEENALKDCLKSYSEPVYKDSFPIPRMYYTTIVTSRRKTLKLGRKSAVESLDVRPEYSLWAVQDYDNQFSEKSYKRRLLITSIGSFFNQDL